MLNPVRREIHKLSLFHQAKLGIAKHSMPDIARLFKCRANLFEIFTVNEERFISFPDAFSIFHDGTVFNTVVLAGISRACISEVERSVFLITDAEKQYVAVQFIQFSNRGAVSENVGKVVQPCL